MMGPNLPRLSFTLPKTVRTSGVSLSPARLATLVWTGVCFRETAKGTWQARSRAYAETPALRPPAPGASGALQGRAAAHAGAASTLGRREPKGTSQSS